MYKPHQVIEAYQIKTEALERDVASLIRALVRLRAAISDYGGHGNPGCPDRAEAYCAMDEADAAIEAVRRTTVDGCPLVSVTHISMAPVSPEEVERISALLKDAKSTTLQSVPRCDDASTGHIMARIINANPAEI